MVKKADLVDNLAQKRKLEIERLEVSIDEELRKKFDGDETTIVSVKISSAVPGVMKELKRLYRGAGWKVSFNPGRVNGTEWMDLR